MTGSLTISKTEGLHAGSGLGPGADQDSSFFPAENAKYGRDPNQFINAEGLLNGDRKYIFKMQGQYQLPWDMLLSGNYQWMTGRPYAPQLTLTDILNQTQAPTIFTQSRDGSLRTSNINLLDLRIQKTFPISGDRWNIAITGDIFNVFNSAAFYDISTTLQDSENFGVGSQFVLPRRLMIGTKINF